jgi:hypothetical protein
LRTDSSALKNPPSVLELCPELVEQQHEPLMGMVLQPPLDRVGAVGEAVALCGAQRVADATVASTLGGLAVIEAMDREVLSLQEPFELDQRGGLARARPAEQHNTAIGSAALNELSQGDDDSAIDEMFALSARAVRVLGHQPVPVCRGRGIQRARFAMSSGSRSSPSTRVSRPRRRSASGPGP